MESYGAADGATDAAKTHQLHKRRRMNIGGICLSLFLVWLLFCVVYAARTFSIRYTQPVLSILVVIAGAIVVLLCLGLAIESIRRRRSSSHYEPMWYMFLFVTALLAFVLANIMGEWNYKTNMSEIYSMSHMNDYAWVDPTRMRGQQMMDAGSVFFLNSTIVDQRLGIGFRNDGIYCVAPITVGHTPLVSYDFWAVGMGCCSGAPGDFKCGQYDNPNAHGGLRLMKDDQRGFYRLAVQQAEATFNIHSDHPLFFHWVADPVAEANNSLADGWSWYMIGMFGHFLLQLFLVILASICYGKFGVY